MMTKVFYFQYHTVTVWAFTRELLETARTAIIRDWEFAHSPAEAISGTKECPIKFIDRSDVHAERYI